MKAMKPFPSTFKEGDEVQNKINILLLSKEIIILTKYGKFSASKHGLGM